MNAGAIIDGVKITREQLKELSKDLGRDLVSITTQEARGLAVDLGRYTLPVGLSEGNADKLQKRIAQDIMRLFPSLDDGKLGAVRIYDILSKVSEKAAKAFWSAFKKGDREEMEKVLAKRITGLPRKINRAAHKSARTGTRGRVRKGAPPVAIVRSRARNNYILKQQKKAGMAKAGWLHAARALGGRVRRGGGRSGGTAETFPAWVRKAGARRKLGGASILSSNRTVVIRMRNSVRHAQEALPDSLKDRAELVAAKRFQLALKKTAEYQARKFNRRQRRQA